MAIYPGKITLKVGASAGSNVEITNIKLMRWRDVHGITPQTVCNTKTPISWHQPHKWVEGELHVLSEADAAFKEQATPYVVPGEDNVIIPYFIATLKDQPGNTKTKTHTGAIIDTLLETYTDGEDTVHVYRFLAYKVE